MGVRPPSGGWPGPFAPLPEMDTPSMKRFLFAALVTLALFGLAVDRASAFGCHGLTHFPCLSNLCNHCCGCCCSLKICCRPYNAFSPCCSGCLRCDGCCPMPFPQQPAPAACYPAD